MNQLLDQDRAELNNEIAGDAMVVIEAEWRILVGSIFAANETLGIEPRWVWKYRRIAVSLADACSQKPALRYALAVECDVFEHPAHHGLSLIDAQCLKHGRHRKIYRAWRCAFFCADRSDESWIVKGRFVIQWKQAVQVSRGNGNFARLDRIQLPPTDFNRIGTSYASQCGTLVRSCALRSSA